MRYFFHIGYLGAPYSGWQKHPDGPSVQQVLEDALSRIFKTPANIIGCGRTDAQVNAAQFFFHWDIANEWDFDLIFRLNNVLPDEIAVFNIIPVADNAHARFDAVERSYDYFIHTYKNPFLNLFSSMYEVTAWDLNAMQRAAGLLLKYDDYRAYCTVPNNSKHTLCAITEAELYINPTGERLRFHISANRFLGKMVRILTGKLIDIGTGKLSVDEFEYHLANPAEPNFIKPAYPRGLFLTKVKYPYLDLPMRGDFIEAMSGTGWKTI